MSVLTKVTCSRCNGSGSYSFNYRRGTVCFGCEGAGTVMADENKLLKQKLAREARQKLKEEERDVRVAEGNRKVSEREAKYRDDPRIGPKTRAKCQEFPLVGYEAYLVLEKYDLGEKIHISCVTRLSI